MRILRYSKLVQFEPWAKYELVPATERREQDFPNGHFDKMVASVKEAGFDYVVVEQPVEVLIERSQSCLTSGG